MKPKKFELGKLYKLRFLDHSVGSRDKMTCEVVGWLIQNDPDHLVLTAWVVDTEDAQIKSDNVEPVSIIKSAILSSRKLS